MEQRKRIGSALCAFCLSASLMLTACGKNPPQEIPSSTEGTQTLCDMDTVLSAADEEMIAYYKSDEFAKEVAQWATKYINAWRVQEGSAECEYLPGMEQVAMYRASQLALNFADDADDERKAHEKFQYGELKNANQHGESPEFSYWESGADSAHLTFTAKSDRKYPPVGASEKTECGNVAQDAGYEIASALKDSLMHWYYIGDTFYSYISVGVECTFLYMRDTDHGRQIQVDGFASVMVNDKNYG